MNYIEVTVKLDMIRKNENITISITPIYIIESKNDGDLSDNIFIFVGDVEQYCNSPKKNIKRNNTLPSISSLPSIIKLYNENTDISKELKVQVEINKPSACCFPFWW